MVWFELFQFSEQQRFEMAITSCIKLTKYENFTEYESHLYSDTVKVSDQNTQPFESYSLWYRLPYGFSVFSVQQRFKEA